VTIRATSFGSSLDAIFAGTDDKRAGVTFIINNNISFRRDDSYRDVLLCYARHVAHFLYVRLRDLHHALPTLRALAFLPSRARPYCCAHPTTTTLCAFALLRVARDLHHRLLRASPRSALHSFHSCLACHFLPTARRIRSSRLLTSLYRTSLIDSIPVH